MSRIGKSPVGIPSGVEIKIDKNIVSVKGPKGLLYQVIASDGIAVNVEDNHVLVTRNTEQKRHKSMHGLYRQLIINMIVGVTQGYTAELELHGIGYRASNRGQLLEMALGYSHPVMFFLPDDVKVETISDKGKPPVVKLTSIDKQMLGQMAAKIKSFRKPEPYKGKGIRFKGEEIRRKAGKTAAK
jgi:large subunit ribosomal protein L6